MVRIGVALPIGKDIEMLKYCTNNLIKRSGLEFRKDWDLFIVCGWNTSQECYDYIEKMGFNKIQISIPENQYWFQSIYDCWNACYKPFEVFPEIEIMITTGSDQVFYYNFLKNLTQFSAPDNIINCRLIERGYCPSIHLTVDFGKVGQDFKIQGFDKYCSVISKNKVITEQELGHRADAMPFTVHRKVWEKFKDSVTNNLMVPLTEQGITGDTDFFDKARAGGIKILKCCNAISYHMGGGETKMVEQERK